MDEENIPAFIPPNEWPPSSHNLNIADNVWGILQSRVGLHRPATLRLFERAIKTEWGKLSVEEIKTWVLSIRRGLNGVIKLQGGFTAY